MSLSYDDLQAIRKIVKETVDPIKRELEALGNDIKEIYGMIASIQKSPDTTIVKRLKRRQCFLENYFVLI